MAYRELDENHFIQKQQVFWINSLIKKRKKFLDLYNDYYQDWMRSILDTAKNKPLKQLMLQVTHDSGAYKVWISQPLMVNRKFLSLPFLLLDTLNLLLIF